jgi:hypothetical protein
MANALPIGLVKFNVKKGLWRSKKDRIGEEL